jgi:hypothetical protein
LFHGGGGRGRHRIGVVVRWGWGGHNFKASRRVVLAAGAGVGECIGVDRAVWPVRQSCCSARCWTRVGNARQYAWFRASRFARGSGR